MKSYKNIYIKVIIGLLDAAMIFSVYKIESFALPLKVGLIMLFLTSLVILTICDYCRPIYRITVVVTIAATIMVTLYLIADKLGLIKYLKDFNTIKSVILSTGNFGIAVYLLLSICQVVFLPIPAAVTILIGVAIYGPLIAFLVSLIGTYIGSTICFFLGKTFGRRLVNWMIGEKTADKYAKMLNEKGKWAFAIMLFLPFFPDDTLCIVAGTTAMNFKFFALSVLFARPLTIAFISFFGSGKIIPYKGWGIPVWIGIIAVCILAAVFAPKIKKKLFDSPKKILSKDLCFEASRDQNIKNTHKKDNKSKTSKNLKHKKIDKGSTEITQDNK